MSLASVLPIPKHHQPLVRGERESVPVTSTELVARVSVVRAYGQRKNWIPRAQEDYGDGGAFPEIHVAQYPLDMGRKDSASQKTVPVTLDAKGRIKYDAIINPLADRQIFSRPEDMTAKLFEEDEMKRPDPEKEAEVTSKTRQALESVLNGKISAAQPTFTGINNKNEPTYIRYTPANQSLKQNSGADHRIIRMTEMPVDPLEPPKFKHKKVPRGPPSPPVPVMHSPPRKVTVKDQQDWKIPPCISNWKNNKGYTIPLDKRLAADGRGLQEIQINDTLPNFQNRCTLLREMQEKKLQREEKLKED